MGNDLVLHSGAELPNVADLCGRKVLGMSGSLTEFINSGSQLESDVYVPSVQHNVTKKSKVKKKLDKNIIPAVISGISMLAMALVLTGGFKRMAPKVASFVKDIPNKIKNIPNAVKDGINNVKKFFKKP